MKREVGRIVGAQDNPDEVGAGTAIEGAFSRMQESNWDFYLTLYQFSSTAGTAEVDLPAAVKDPALLRCSASNERRLRYIRYDNYSRRVPHQTNSSTPTFYTLFRKGQYDQLWLLPNPSESESFDFWYFREANWPSGEETALDIPKWMERPILLQAQSQVAMMTTSFPTTRLGLLVQLADDAMRGARGRDRNVYDDEPGLEPNDGGEPLYPWGHPDRNDY